MAPEPGSFDGILYPLIYISGTERIPKSTQQSDIHLQSVQKVIASCFPKYDRPNRDGQR
jgi:hypothetical protein